VNVLSATHKKFGLRIKELRYKLNMSQEDLAFKVGVDRSYMGFLERGQKNATLKNITKIADALHVSLSDLFQSV